MKKFPGSQGTKVFLGVSLIVVGTGYPLFKSSSGGKQGEHYFSQERPEQIVRAQEKQKKEYRELRKAKYLEEQKQAEGKQ